MLCSLVQVNITGQYFIATGLFSQIGNDKTFFNTFLMITKKYPHWKNI